LCSTMLYDTFSIYFLTLLESTYLSSLRSKTALRMSCRLCSRAAPNSPPTLQAILDASWYSREVIHALILKPISLPTSPTPSAYPPGLMKPQTLRSLFTDLNPGDFVEYLSKHPYDVVVAYIKKFMEGPTVKPSYNGHT